MTYIRLFLFASLLLVAHAASAAPQTVTLAVSKMV